MGVNTDQLMYHTDWNLIHDVFEAIENLKHTSVYTAKTKLGEYTVEISYETSSNSRQSDKTVFIRGVNKKNASIEALDKFLIWYLQEHKK